MIAYISGELMSSLNGVAVLLNNGIGYEITCSASAFCRLVNDQKGGVYTYLAVRDDGVSLYGFDTVGEKEMFLKLISVSGVGPKMGMTVLSGMNLRDLALCIASSDVKTLSSIKGLGKKTAERIILELREAVSSSDISPQTSVRTPIKEVSTDFDNAVLALMSLGYTRQVSEKAVDDTIKSGVQGLESIITSALKNMI